MMAWIFIILLLSLANFIGQLMYKSFEKTCNRIKAKFVKMAVRQVVKDKPAPPVTAAREEPCEMPEVTAV